VTCNYHAKQLHNQLSYGEQNWSAKMFITYINTINNRCHVCCLERQKPLCFKALAVCY